MRNNIKDVLVFPGSASLDHKSNSLYSFPYEIIIEAQQANQGGGLYMRFSTLMYANLG